MKPNEVDEALQLARQMLQTWMQLKRFLIKANTSEPLTKDDERQFLEGKSEAARLQRSLTEKVKDKINYGANRLQDFLRQTISVSHMRNLPVNDRRALFKEWHVVYIQLTRLAGALEFAQQTGHVPRGARKGGGETTISSLKAGASSSKAGKRRGIPPAVFIIIGIGVAAGIAYYFIVGAR
ncbi:MAG: hypothetical protein Kow0059_02710 [Candidatus Sumerlaeia bacterium]